MDFVSLIASEKTPKNAINRVFVCAYKKTADALITEKRYSVQKTKTTLCISKQEKNARP